MVSTGERCPRGEEKDQDKFVMFINNCMRIKLAVCSEESVQHDNKIQHTQVALFRATIMILKSLSSLIL